MRVIYVAPKYDYGDQSRGLSYEHCNFYDTLVHMGLDIIYFDLVSEYQSRGAKASSDRLLEIIKLERPDLLFCVLGSKELDIDTIRLISISTDTVTFNWFCDDHWRFDNYSRYWAPAFNWVSTTAASALPKYRRLGYKNVIKTQWACNHFSYHPLQTALEYDVTFVGQPHGTRFETIASLRRAGIDVRTWGYGWEAGRLSQEGMVEVFNKSRINLNLSNASSGTRRAYWRSRLLRQPMQLLSQIKGRNFEVPGCCGFLLTDIADNLFEYYVPDEEVSVFVDPADLVKKVQFFLEHESKRQRIAAAGYRRTMAEHTYERRFIDIFATIGLTTMQQHSDRQMVGE